MEGSESAVDKKISFNLADERIKLIDILSEDDDDFLVASPFCGSLGDSFSGNYRDQTGFRLSGFRNFQEIETIQQIEKSPENIVKKGRPSFLRRSLAWDSAFFSSAGVLDPDELSLINKGTGTIEDHLLPGNRDVRTRGPGLESRANDGCSHLDWFEIEPFQNRRPSVYKSELSQMFDVGNISTESGLRKGSLKNSQAQNKVEKSFKDKTIERSGKVAKSSPKPPKSSSGRAVSNTRDSSGKSNVKMENKSGQSSAAEKKLASMKSTNLSLSRLFSPKLSSSVSPAASIASLGTSSPQASSSFLRRKTETRKSKLSSSLSASQIWKDSERSKVVGNVNHSLSLLNHPKDTAPCSSKLFSSLGSLDKTQRTNVSKIDFDTKMTTRGPSLHNDAEEATYFQRKFPKSYSSSNAAAQTCYLGSLSAKNFRPSKLRPPSPTFGFFDENTPLSSHGEIISRKLSQKVQPERTLFDANSEFRFSSSNIELLPESSLNQRHTSANRNTASPSSNVGRKIKRLKSPPLLTDKEKLESRRSVSDGKRPRYKLGSYPILEEEKRKGVLKNKRCKGSSHEPTDEETEKKKKLYTSSDQVNFLSKYFEAIDLNQNKKTTQHEQNHVDLPSDCDDNKTGNRVVIKMPNALAKPCSLSPLSSVSKMRTPLADSNFSRTIALPMDPKKGNLVKMASLYSSEKEKRTRIS
ncbi:hypothetical protein ACJIZ3_022951 [Penstemon smallii]|uniref:Uncharacterized protein n=1 Tax=Penstemon smallii TaxID=265156 RepID=A0ABD3TQ12_9LAMI